MNVCTAISSGPLDQGTFLIAAGLGLIAIALVARWSKTREAVEMAEKAIPA